MSVSFTWQLQRKAPKPAFRHGTSSDVHALENTFPGGVVSSKDVGMLRAMHRATGEKASLWLDIAEKLSSLQGDDYDREVILEIGTEY